MGYENGDDEEKIDDGDLQMPIFPISYYERKGRGDPPGKIQEFFTDNYTHLAIAGVFAVLVVYLSELTNSPDRSIIIGMVGGAIMFVIAFAIVINNGLIEFARAYNRKSLLTASLYAYTVFALIFIAFGLISTFARYPTTSIEALDTLSALTLIIVYVLILRVRFTFPFQTNFPYDFSLELGRITGFIARKTFLISLIIGFVFGTVPEAWLMYIGLPARSTHLAYDSVFLKVLISTSSFLLTVVTIFALTILSRITYLKLKSFWRATNSSS